MTTQKKSLKAVVIVALAASLALATLAAESPGNVVDRFQEAYRAGSVPQMLELYSADAVFEDVNQRHRFAGTEQLQMMLGALVAMHHRLGLEESRRVIAGDTVVVEYAYTGQLNGAAMGSAMGKEGCPDLEYTLPTTSWFKVKDGRIVEQRDFIDWATFLELRQKMLAASAN